MLLKENLATQIVWKIGLIYRLHMQNVSGVNEKYGLYPGQSRILHTIAEMNGSIQKEIAAKLNITPASLTVSIKRLQKVGIVEKSPDAIDLRNNRIFITEKGQGIRSDSVSELIQGDNALLNGFSSADVEQLVSYLTRLQINLEKAKELAL